MSLIEYTLDGTVNKVDVAIKRLRAFEPPEGYYLAFSGGKDSVTVKALMDLAGVKYDAHYSVTSVDPPELVQFIKTMPDVSRDIPHDADGKPITMWTLIPQHLMPPTRVVRYCCNHLKESSGAGRITVTGVRWAESVRRKKNRNIIDIGANKNTAIKLNEDNDEARRLMETCYRKKKTLLNPIIDWEDADVWEFIHSYNVPYCVLYDCGFKRLGCIGCPMSTHQSEELERWPKYKAQYIRSFEKMLQVRRDRGIMSEGWKTGTEVMDWWIHGGSKCTEQIDGQTDLWEDET